MADYDNRRDYRGGRQPFNKRKRFREDDDVDQGFRNQRQRHAPPPPGTQIRRGLIEIGVDSIRLPHETAMRLARLVAENYNDEFVKDALSTVALKMVVEQPLKTPFVAAVILFAHQEKKEVAQDVAAKAGEQLQEYLNKGQWRNAKLMLRFLACLSPVFEADGILPILDELFNRAVDLQTASQEDAVGLELVKIILLTIPYLLAYAEDTTLAQKATELLEKTDIVASTPHPVEPLVDPYPDAGDDAERPMVCTNVIALLQRQLQEEAANGWPLRPLPRIFDPSLKPNIPNGDEMNGEENGEENGETNKKIAFPAVNVPSPINPGSKTVFPELFFSVFADNDIESVPPTSNIASMLLRDAIIDTINLLDFNRNVAARLLNEIDCFFAQGTFAKRGIAFDRLRDTPDGQSTWKPEDIVIDAVFSQILALPAPEHRLVYYHSIITESCKISPAAIAPSLGRAIRSLFRSLDAMDAELGYRYMDWFAHHLSNFEFRWKWAEWIPDLKLPALDPKMTFIKGLLDKEIRLSFAKRIRSTLPQEYHELIPASKEKDIPEFKFKDEHTPFAKEGQLVMSLLRKKAPEEDVQKVLDSVHEQASTLGMDNDEAMKRSTDIYVTVILSIGSKSLSHVLSTIDRCKKRLLAIGTTSDSARRQIITSVFDFWHEHPGTAVNILDKLLNYTIITPMGVIEWALRDNIDRGRALASPHVFELVAITMFKVSNRVRQLLHHRNNTTVAFTQRQQIDEALPRERQGMRDLFAAIEDAVAAVAAGAQDEMIERFDGEAVEQDFIKAWGARWARVWRRKAAVEEQTVNDGLSVEMVEPAAVPLPAETGDEGLEDMDQIS